MTDHKPFLDRLPLWAKRLGVGLAMAAVAAGLVLVFVVPTGGAKPTATKTDQGPAIVETPKAVPSKSQAEIVKDLGGAGDSDGADGGGPSLDVSKEDAFALKVVKEWITWDSTESAASRQARLAPYFPTGSSVIKEQPVTSNGPALAHKGAVTKTQIDSTGYAGLFSFTDTEVTLNVTYRYISTAVYGGYTYNYSGSATFRVNVPRGLPAGSTIDDIQEPSISF